MKSAEAFKVLEKIILAETLPTWTKRDRKYKMKRKTLGLPNFCWQEAG